MRWHVLALFGFLLGLVQLFAGPQVPLPLPRVRGEFLFLVAFHAGMRCRRSHILPAFWLCGLMQDLFLGHHLGASVILYSLLAMVVAGLRGPMLEDHLPMRMGLVLVLVFLLGFVRPLVEEQVLAGIFSIPALRVALGCAVYTALLSPVTGWVLNTRWLRTWVPPATQYGLPPAS